MTVIILFVSFIGFIFLSIQTVSAAPGIRQTINFQGKLVDDEGLNVANSTYSVVFTLYDAASGGTQLWQETRSVSTSDGIFREELGTSTSLSSVDFNSDSIYLGIKVGADAEMTPRVRFTATPYAFQAKNVPWSGLQDAAANLAVSMGSYTSTFTYGSSTGANDLFKLTDTASNTGTGRILSVRSASGSTVKPFHVSAGGAEAILVDANGNVGIGTTNPTRKLDVNGTFRLRGQMYDYNNEVGTPGQVLSTTSNGVDWIDAGSVGTDNQTLANVYSQAGNTVQLTGAYGDIRFYRGTSTEMLFLHESSGNVGIGTTNPTYKLSVNGSVEIVSGSELYSFGSATLGNRSYTTPTYVSSGQTFTASIQALDDAVEGVISGSGGVWSRNAGSGYLFPQTLTDSVGIGTSTPTAKLQVVGNIVGSTLSDGTISITSGTIAGVTSIAVSDGLQATPSYTFTNDSNTGFYRPASDSIGIGTSGVERIRVAPNGNVGIGTTNPGYKLDVTGDIRIANGSELYSYGSATLGNRTYTEDNYVTDGQTFTASIDALDQQLADVIGGAGGVWSRDTGNGYLFPQTLTDSVGIGTTSPSEKLHVVGNAIISGNITSGGIITGTGSGLTGLNASNLASGTVPSARISGNYGGITGVGTITSGTWQGSVISATYLDPAVILATEIDTYTELNTIVADVTLTHNGLIDTSAEIAGIVGDETGSGALVFANSPTFAGNVLFPGSGIWESTGDVGIGTTNPGYKLDVNGDVRIASGSELYSFGSATLGNRTYTEDNYVTDGQTFTASINALDQQLADVIGGAGGVWSRNAGSGYLYPQTLTDSVGIGTSVPSEKLHVIGNAIISGNITSGGIITGTGSGLTGLNASNLASGTVPSARVSGNYSGITGVGTITSGTWQGSVISSTYLDPAVILSTEIDTYTELNTIVADVTLTHNGLIDTSAEIAGIVGDETGTGSLVFSNSPALVTPNIGAATGTSLNVTGAITAGGIITGTGSGLTALNASNLTTGTVPDGRLVGAYSNFSNVTGSGNSQFANFRAGDGTRSAPSYSFTSDTNTGMYRIGTDILSFATAGADQLTILAGGNVGIGTTNPTYKLSVNGSLEIVNGSELYSFGSATLGNRSYTTPTYVSSGQTFTASIQALDNAVEGIVSGSGGVWSRNAGSGYLYPQTLTDSVGIGTSVPSEKLHVVGNAIISGNITSGGIITGTGSGLTGLNASNLASGTVPSARVSGNYSGITGVGTITSGTWQGSVISSTYLDPAVILSTEIDTYSELNTIVADVTLTHNGLIDTYTELNTIVSDVTLTHNGLIDTSAEIAGIVGDETGTGSLVFSNSPALVTPNIGAATGTSLNVTGAITAGGIITGTGSGLTGLNASNLASGTVPSARVSGNYSGITGVGTITSGTWQGSVISSTYLDPAVILSTEIDTSSEIATIVGDETGSGALVFANAPTFAGNVRFPGSGIWESTGDVGIGTTNPTAKLEVAGQIKITGGSPGANKVLTSDASGLATWETLGAASIGDDSLDFDKFKDVMLLDANTSVDQNGYNFSFFNTGNVGIGTSNPSQKLEVSGNALISTNLYVGTTDVQLSRGAANRLDLASGDSLNLVSGDVQVGGTTVITSGRIVQATNGSRTAPAFTFSADTNTGMYRIGTDILSLATAGSDRLTVLANGSVGIGRTNPSFKLDVAGGTRVSALNIGSRYFSDGIYNYTNGILIATDIATSDNRMMELIVEGNSYSSNGPIETKIQAYNYTGSGTIIQTSGITEGPSSNVDVFHYGGYVYFWLEQTNTFQTMRFQLRTHSGNHTITSITNAAKPVSGVTNSVTIVPMKAWYAGNDGASSGLDADLFDSLNSDQFLRSDTSDNYTSGTLAFNGGTTLDINGDLSIADTSVAFDGASTNFVTTGNFSINTDDLFINKSNSRVGIGTTNPGAAIEVAGQVKITGGSPGANKVLTSDASGLATWETLGAASIGDDSLDFDKFADAMTLDAKTIINQAGFDFGFQGTGNVGIGTTTPSEKLHVIGNAIISGNITSGGIITGTGSGLTGLNASNLASGTVPSARVSGNYSGITGVGTITSGTWQGSVISSTYLDPAVILSTEIDTYTELNTIVADVTLTHNGLIDTSAEIAGIVGDETGTGSLVFSNSPALVTPNIGAATGTSLSLTGTITTGNGSRTAPSHSFASDTNTGMYRIGTDILGFATAGADRLTILADGSVGIGTTDPNAKLDVNGAARVGYDANTTSYIGRAAVGYGGGYSDYAYFGHLDLAGAAGNYALLQSSTGTTLLNAASGAPINFRINNTTMGELQADGDWAFDTTTLFVDAADNQVGIGTNDPAYKLQVQGTGQGLTLMADAINQADSSNIRFMENTTSGFRMQYDGLIDGLRFKDQGTDLDIAYFGRDGDIGIGTTNPGAALEVAGQVKITGGSPGANKVLMSDSSGLATWETLGEASITDDSLDFDKFRDNMTLDAKTTINQAGFDFGFQGTGNVGIGTTNPGAKLHVAGTGLITGNVDVQSGLDVTGASLTVGGSYSWTTGGVITAATDETINGIDISAGAISDVADITLNSAGQIDFADVAEDKVYWYSNTYGTGVEGSTLTNWSASQFRWRIGGTSATTGTEELFMNGTTLRPGTNGGLDLGSSTVRYGTAYVNDLCFDGGTDCITGAPIDGTGTANRVAYWTDTDTLAADNDFFFNGTNVGIGTITPQGLFSVDLPAWTNRDTDSQHVIFGNSTDDDAGIRFGYNFSQNRGIINVLNPTVAWGDLILQDNGGEVGIGTTAPGAKLHVVGDQWFDGWTYMNSAGNNLVFNTDASTRTIWEVQRGSLGTRPSQLWNVQATSTDDLVFSGTTAGDFVVDSANVGIGTATPSDPLHVVSSTDDRVTFDMSEGTIQLSSYAAGALPYSGAAGLYVTDTSVNIMTGLNNTGQINFNTITGGSWQRRMTILNSGLVGIGTDAPSSALDVIGSIELSGSITDSTDNYVNINDYLSVELGTYDLSIEPRNTWGNGATNYPTIRGSHSNEWVMLHFPHIPYLQNGAGSYSGTTAGAIVRLAADSGASTYWDVGIDSDLGGDTFGVSRGTSNFFRIASNGTVTIPGLMVSDNLGVIYHNDDLRTDQVADDIRFTFPTVGATTTGSFGTYMLTWSNRQQTASYILNVKKQYNSTFAVSMSKVGGNGDAGFDTEVNNTTNLQLLFKQNISSATHQSGSASFTVTVLEEVSSGRRPSFTVVPRGGGWTAPALPNNYLGSGNVGIGTAGPSEALDVIGNIELSGVIQDSTDGILNVSDALTTTGSILNSAANGELGASANFVFRDTGDSWLRLRTASGGSTYADLAINNLHTNGNIQNVGTLSFSSSANHRISSNASGLLFDGGDGSNWDFLVYDDNVYSDNLILGYTGSAQITTYDTNENLIIDPNGTGLVGIGSGFTPTSDLHIGGSSTTSDGTPNIPGVQIAGGTGGWGKLELTGGVANTAGHIDFLRYEEIGGDFTSRIIQRSGSLNFATTAETNFSIRNDTGAVGIGTTSPAYPLDVLGNGRMRNNLYIGTSGNYLTSQPTGNYGSIQINASGKGNWEGYSIDGRSVFMHDGANGTGIYNDVDNEWLFYAVRNAASNMYYNGTARVTTTSAGATITGNAVVTGNLTVNSNITGVDTILSTSTGTSVLRMTSSTGSGRTYQWESRSDGIAHFTDLTANSQRITVQANGNVGINDVSPTEAKLSVGGTGYFSGALSSGGVITGNGGMQIGSSSVANPTVSLNMRRNSSYQQALRTDGGTSLHLLPFGNASYWNQVCIGCGGTASLTVSGNLQVNGGTKNFLIDHPLDKENKYLIHSVIEGAEAAVYYRGYAKLVNGRVTIKLPEYFEALTRKESRTALFSPINGSSPLFLEGSVSNGEFTVVTSQAGNPNQEFTWEIKAERSDVDKLGIEAMKKESVDGMLADVGEKISYSNTIGIPTSVQTNWNESGTLVALDTENQGHVRATMTSYDNDIVGVIAAKYDTSTYELTETTSGRPTTINGKTNLKVLAKEDKPIQAGDPITSSPAVGTGMKAVQAGTIVGKALESTETWHESSCPAVNTIQEINWPANNAKACYRLPDGSYIGKISVFVNPTWYDPGTKLNAAGDLSLTGIDGIYSVKNDADNITLDNSYAAKEMIAAYLKTGKILTTDLKVSGKSEFTSLEVSNFKLGGKTLNEYIEDSVISGQVFTSLDDQLTAQEAQIQQLDLESNILSTSVASQSATLTTVTARLDQIEQATNDTEAVITSLQDRIAALETMFANNMSTSSAMLFTESPSATVSGSIARSISDTEVIFDKKLISEDDLTVLGKLNTSDIGVTGTISSGLLTINGFNDEMATPSATISTLGGILSLQHDGMSGIEFVAGKVAIDVDGNVLVREGDVEIENGDLVLRKGSIKGSTSIRGIDVPVTAGATEVTVSFTDVNDTDTYAISVLPTWFTNIIVQDKTIDGFKILFDRPAPADATLDWLIVE